MKQLIALVVISLLYGCQNYSFSLNNNELYSPRPPFSNYAIQDPQLATCVAQAIKDQEVRTAGQLRLLSCSYAGIEQLDGLEVFYKLQSLNLAHNKLTDTRLLLQLSDLKILNLSHNRLNNAQTLLDLPHLEKLNLDHNKQLACNLENLPENIDLRLPEHCFER